MSINLNSNSLSWALKHIEKYGDTDIFPVPFEFQAIRSFWNSDISPFLLKLDLQQHQVRPYLQILTPKHKLGFRIGTHIDPLDSIIFTALVKEIGQDIEDSRIEKAKNIVFSYRFSPMSDGTLWDPNYNWDGFQSHSKLLATDKKYKYVLTADIADFYPRIYFHRLENALDQCSNKTQYLTAVKNMIKGWNVRVSYGIPVGCAASRLLAELVLDDVDRALISEGVVFCRWVDDYRIFCISEQDAYEKLATLAELLFENHGLTLQQHKTNILPINEFMDSLIDRGKNTELNKLATESRKIIDSLGIRRDPYRELNFNSLDLPTKKLIEGLNLTEVLREELVKAEVDTSLARFLLLRISQFDNVEDVNLVLGGITKLYALFKEVIIYVERFRTNNPDVKKEIGTQILGLLNSYVCHLPYHRMWLFSLFTKNREWDNEDQFVRLFNKYPDEFSQRQLILALGRAHEIGWIRSRRRHLFRFSPWEKRAFLAAASCLSKDEYHHWSKSIKGNLDILESVVLKWAADNRF